MSPIVAMRLQSTNHVEKFWGMRGVMAGSLLDVATFRRMLAREHGSAKRRARAPLLWTTGASERDDLAIDGRGAWW
jgi:hypothetical protein